VAEKEKAAQRQVKKVPAGEKRPQTEEDW